MDLVLYRDVLTYQISTLLTEGTPNVYYYDHSNCNSTENRHNYLDSSCVSYEHSHDCLCSADDPGVRWLEASVYNGYPPHCHNKFILS